MKPILFVTDANFLSHLLRSMEIARVLRNRGHKVLFAADGLYLHFLEKHGFEYHRIYTNDPVHTMKATRASMFRYYNADRIRKSVTSEVACIQKADPEIVVGDFRWTLRMSAEYCRVPYVGIINTMWTPYYSRMRSISEKMVLRKIFGRRFMEKFSPFGQRLMMRRRGKPFYKLCRELGITPIKNLNREMYGDYNLMPDLPEFCPTENLPDNFCFIGPLFASDDMIGVSRKANLPAEPYLYATLGSTATPKMISKLFDAFAGKAVSLVMTTGNQPIQTPVPGNIHLFDYLPAGQAYANATAVVCHGGQGTLYQALSYGMPIIGIATHNDQQWNLDRVTDLQLGKQFGEDSCSPHEIYDAYSEVTTDPIYRKNCMAMRDRIKQYNAPEKAADEIENFARTTTLYRTGAEVYSAG